MSTSRFVWFELHTPDPMAAATFYAAALGWTSADMPVEGQPHRVFLNDGVPVAGVSVLRPEAIARGAPPHWLGHVAVADIGAAVARAAELGGEIIHPPVALPEIGSVALITDPEGAHLSLYQPDPGRDTAPPEPMRHPGHVGWSELMATDWQSVWPFYANLLGWQKGETFDMGPRGIYQIIEQGGLGCGGLFTRPPDSPGPAWLFYVVTRDIDTAAGRLAAAGATLLLPPHEVPGSMWITQFRDPQGAVLALVGPRAG